MTEHISLQLYNFLRLMIYSIMHRRNHLDFPSERRLTPEAKDLICTLLPDVDDRLGSCGVDEIMVTFLIMIWNLLTFLILTLYLRRIILRLIHGLNTYSRTKSTTCSMQTRGEWGSFLVDTGNFVKYDDVWLHAFSTFVSAICNSI